MKADQLENVKPEKATVFYETLEEALQAKLSRTEQVMEKLSPQARARLEAETKNRLVRNA